MIHNVINNRQFLLPSRHALSSVPTVLVCQNTLIRSGLGQLLSGTPFIISDEPPEHASDMPTLCLIHADQVTADMAETVERLKGQRPVARVVLLADNMEPAVLMAAFQAGLDGLCLTAMAREPLIKALELVMLGETFVPAATSIALLQRTHARPGAEAGTLSTQSSAEDYSSVRRLSDREAQILRCLTQGASNKLIARDLGLAEATVKVHIKAILRKVKAANRTQAAMWAQQHLNHVANDTLMVAAE